MNKALTALFIVLLLAWWLTWPFDSKVIQPKQPNTVSRSDSLSESRKSEPTNQQSSVQASTTFELSAVTEDKKVSEQFSYLQLYRNFRFNETCPIRLKQLMAAENDMTIKQSLLEDFEQSGIQVNQSVTAFQLNQYEMHLDQCIQLAENYQDKMTQWSKSLSSLENDSLSEYMAQKLLSTSALTYKEKQLKELRKLIQPWDDAWQKLFNVSKGIISAEAQAIKIQLDEFENNWRHQIREDDFEFTDEFRAVNREISEALKAQLEQLIQKDPKAKDQAWQQVKLLANEIKQYMQLQDFDLFFEASALLNDNRTMRHFNGGVVKHSFKNQNLNKLEIPYQKVAEDVMQLTGQISRLNYLAIAPFANQLYLCTVGQDCTPGSTLMNHYCFSAEYPTACEKDLMAFFIDDYLSPNQLQDVLNLYEQLVIIYAR